MGQPLGLQRGIVEPSSSSYFVCCGAVYRGLSDSIVVSGIDYGESRGKGEGEEKGGPPYKCPLA